MNTRIILPMLLLLASPALAGTTAKPWISGNLSGSTYAMTDVNADIGQINAIIAPSGVTMNTVDKGAGLGAAVGVDLGSGFTAGIGYDHLAANSKAADASGSIEYDMPANIIRVLGRYTFSPATKSSGFLEASLGRVSTSGTVALSAAGSGSVSGKMTGSGMAFEFGVGGQAWTTPQFAFTGSLGFRHAPSGDVTVDGMPIHNANGSAYTIDYSGIFVRAGVTLALAQ